MNETWCRGSGRTRLACEMQKRAKDKDYSIYLNPSPRLKDGLFLKLPDKTVWASLGWCLLGFSLELLYLRGGWRWKRRDKDYNHNGPGWTTVSGVFKRGSPRWVYTDQWQTHFESETRVCTAATDKTGWKFRGDRDNRIKEVRREEVEERREGGGGECLSFGLITIKINGKKKNFCRCDICCQGKNENEVTTGKRLDQNLCREHSYEELQNITGFSRSDCSGS